MRHVRITQLDALSDAKLPNLALMKLSAWHRQRGDHVHFFASPFRELGEPEYAAVYGSAIFEKSRPMAEQLSVQFPGALVGGTGTTSVLTVEAITGEDFDELDYDLYPDFTGSLGFTARGCRFKCGFCVVPKKEGRPKGVATIADIWRGEPWPKHIHLLDNDFFGQAKALWKARTAEIRDGGFAVCFNQGVNVRVITEEIAEELASLDYRDDGFRKPRLYTAWDNLGDERLFFNGVDRLERAGVKPSHLMAYMLVGYDPAETWATVLYRFEQMVALRIWPFAMVYGDDQRGLPLGGCNADVGHQRLADFRRWVNGGIYRRAVSFESYDVSTKWDHFAANQGALFSDGRES